MPNVVIEVEFKYMALGLNKVRLNVGIMVGCPARLYVPLVCELRYTVSPIFYAISAHSRV